jgi:hypothetical protein
MHIYRSDFTSVVHMHVCIQTHKREYLYIFIHTYIHTQRGILPAFHTSKYIHTHIHTYTGGYPTNLPFTHPDTTRTRAHTHTHTNTGGHPTNFPFTHPDIYINTHARTRTQMDVLLAFHRIAEASMSNHKCSMHIYTSRYMHKYIHTSTHTHRSTSY